MEGKRIENTKNLMDYVVTPYFQNYKKKDTKGLSLKTIFEDLSLKDRFAKNTFPNYQVMEDGQIFIDPVTRVFSTMSEYYLKWFILDENCEIMSNHSYPMIDLPEKGYLMKVVIPVLGGRDFQIEYFENISNIHIGSSFQSVGMDQQTNHSLIETDLSVESVDYQLLLTKIPSVTDGNFYDKYLSHVFDR